MAVVVAGVGLAPAAKANPEAERSVTLGGSVIVKPKYEGSDEYEYIQSSFPGSPIRRAKTHRPSRSSASV